MSEAKKMKFDRKKKNFIKPGFAKKQFLECGQRGFLATCNFRERDTIRDCYMLLNDYADRLYPETAVNVNAAQEATNDKTAGEAKPESEDSDNEVDISKQLEQQITQTQAEQKKKAHRFQVVDSGCQNLVFIKTSLTDPVAMAHTIMTDAAETKLRRTRHLLRLLPVESICKANLPDIIDAGGQLFDKYFLKEGKTYSIVFNKRYNNAIQRDEVIKELAILIDKKNMKNKVDLKNAQLSVIVEIVKGLCCLSVVPDYLLLKKYNITELTANNDPDDSSASTKAEDVAVEEQKEEAGEADKCD